MCVYLIHLAVWQKLTQHCEATVCVLVTQSYLTLRPQDCGPPGSSVHAILQASILEWVTISDSRGSSRPGDRTWVSCTAGRFFTVQLR